MQTSPCGHRVVCRRCFVKTIQSAVAQRLLPLRCVICRARVNRLTSSSGTWRIQESASSYSMGAKSWASAGVAAGGVVPSASSYSMNDAHSGHHSFHQPTLHKSAVGRHHTHHYTPRGSTHGHGRVSQSDSLYSMSSTGSAASSASGYSHYSKTSSISSNGPCSPALPVGASSSNHLAPPSPTTHHHAHGPASPTPSGSSGSSLSPRDNGSAHSHHGGGCPIGCSGAVPRKPLNTLSNSCSTPVSGSSSSGSGGGGGGVGGNGSGASGMMTPTHTYPGRRHVKNRLMDIQNRLPPIKEFRSPAKVPHPSPVHVSNPRFRYSTYTKSSAHELAPLLREPGSSPPPRRPSPMNIQLSCSALAPPPLKAGGAKICPVTSKNSLPKNAYVMPKDKKPPASVPQGKTTGTASKSAPQGAGCSRASAGCAATNSGSAGCGSASNPKPSSSSSSRSFPLFSAASNQREKADNKKNESVERKKKEEKLKLKAEKEARKEEKRLAKEEERLAKLHAKEEKKRGKKEAKELLLANDGNSKK
ncbi:uncharacterized protein LOC108036496 isoform X2 [Drosophila biarmipes]|nr:uncharacterized protein LOC108036496 isoform X2 [Drosophila biarmipes]